MSQTSTPQDWVCVVEWIQAGDQGAYLWDVYLLHDDGPEKIESGTAFWRITVYIKVWTVCRRRGLKFRPWSKTWKSGELPKEDDD